MPRTNDASFITERTRSWGVGTNYTFGPAMVDLAHTNPSHKSGLDTARLGSRRPADHLR